MTVSRDNMEDRLGFLEDTTLGNKKDQAHKQIYKTNSSKKHADLKSEMS